MGMISSVIVAAVFEANYTLPLHLKETKRFQLDVGRYLPIVAEPNDNGGGIIAIKD